MGFGHAVVLVGGGHSAGKRTVCNKISNIISDINDVHIETLDLDSLVKAGIDQFNTPQRIDFENVLHKIDELSADYKDKKLVILIPGLYALYNEQLRSLASIKVFLACDADTRLNRWVKEAVLENGESLEEVLSTYLNIARPEFNEFILPTKEFADVVLPGDNSHSGILLICDGLVPLLTHSHHPLIEKHKSLYHPHQTSLNLQSEGFDDEKNRFYQLD